MAISFIATATGNTNTMTEPAGAQSGDIEICIISTSSSTMALPAGWTQIGPKGNAGAYYCLAGYIVRGAGAPSLTFTGSAPLYAIAAYRGGSFDAGGGTSASAVSPSVNAITATDLLVCLTASSLTAAPGAPAGMTSRASADYSGIADLNLTASGATATKTWSPDGTPIGSYSLTLKPPVTTPKDASPIGLPGYLKAWNPSDLES